MYPLQSCLKNLRITLLVPLALLLFLPTGCRKLDEPCATENEGCGDVSITTEAGLDRKVMIIGIDGFRSEAMQAVISPQMYDLSQDANTYYTAENRVESLTFSGPNWSSLATGVHWCKHNVIDNDFSVNSLNFYPHFFHYVEEADSSLVTASLVNWIPINTHLAQFHADYAPETSHSDEEVFLESKEMLLNANPMDPDVLFLVFDDLDGAGHGYGFSSEVTEYRATLSTIDGYVGELIDIIEDKRTAGENWLICIVSDHGGDGTGHSGGENNPYINQTILYVNSPEVTFMSDYVSGQVDLVPTVMDYLGIEHSELNCQSDGVSLILN